MKTEKLRLKGFTGIKKGLGLDEIEIDFSNIIGLVAFEGDNGSGKTTVLENLHPYNSLASRDGALFHHVFLRDSEKELSFTYGGHQYRTLIKIDCQSEKQEGFIWVDAQSVVNGKISAYAKYIKDLLGSPNLFFASVFCAQNSAKLSDMTTGELKGLFSEFLRLDRLQEYENTAKQAGNVYNGQLGQIDIRIAGLKERLPRVEKIRNEIKANHDEMLSLQADLDCKKGELSSYHTETEKLKETMSRNALLIQRKADLTATIERLQAELGKEKTDAEAEIEALKTKYRELAGEVAKCEATLKDKDSIMGAADREKEISPELERLSLELDGLTKNIADHQDNIHGIETRITTLKQKIKDLDNDQIVAQIDKKITDLSIKITAQKQAIADTYKDRQEIDLTNKITQLRDKTSTLKLKDPACQSSTCSFIVGALDAQEEIPKLQAQLAELMSTLESQRTEYGKRLDILNTSLTSLDEERKTRFTEIEIEREKLIGEDQFTSTALKEETEVLKIKTEASTQTRQDIARLRTELTQVKELASKLTEVQLAEFRNADLVKAQEDVVAQGKEKREAWTAKETSLQNTIGAYVSQSIDLDSKIDTKAAENLTVLTSEIESIEKVTLPTIEKQILETREKMAGLQSELSRMADAELEIKTAQTERDRITSEISEWTYLKNACGKNGLQALEIDGAAPLITGYANDLLSRAFGPLFTVKFHTQDDEGKEVLDIVVIGEDGEDVLLENLSGGQKVWVLKALRLAMTLLSKEKSGRNFENFFSDEEDGSLDVDNARNFIALYDAFMKIGKFTTGYFISHKPECRSLADNVLMFEPGKNPRWK